MSKIPMEIGFIGLGRMGKNMVLRLLENSNRVVVWNRSPEPVEEVEKKGAIPSTSITNLMDQLINTPKIIWIMLPAGDITEQMINKISPYLKKGDILVDGGNANFNDSIRRNKNLDKKGINFMDIGVSGGLIGAKKGYCMMAGGEKSAFEHIKPLLSAMCIKDGFAYMGESGTGHYVKMIHNSIEYGIMQAMAEGFELLHRGRFKNLNLKDITHVWNHGSIISSFLMVMAENAFKSDPILKHIEPCCVKDSGEGHWAALEAMEYSIPFTVNTYALHARYASRDPESMAYKTLNALRNEFGGHPIKTRE